VHAIRQESAHDGGVTVWFSAVAAKLVELARDRSLRLTALLDQAW
jgi:hypothetical protein